MAVLAGKCEVYVSPALWKAVMAERGRSRSRGGSTPRRTALATGSLELRPGGVGAAAYNRRRVPDRNMTQGLRVDRGAALTADAPSASTAAIRYRNFAIFDFV